MNAIEIRNLSKTLDGFTLSIDKLDIKKGFITGFIGPMKEAKLKDIKKNIALFYKNWDESLYKYYLNKFNIDENKIYKELSKGQQKKFELIMALCHHPKLIIMDEPTANLDPIVRNEFIEVLQEHIEKDGVTVFYSTHITSDLDKVGDYLVFIYNGKIILNGDKESILESHRIIRGSKDLLDDDTKKAFISYKESSFGFEGLTSNHNVAYEIFGEEVVYDKANLEDILMYYTRG